MNILICNDYYYPNMVGGTEQSCRLLAEGLASRGHSVSVLTFDGCNKYSRETIEGVEVTRGYSPFYRLGSLAWKQSGIQKVSNKFFELFCNGGQQAFDELFSGRRFDIAHVNNTCALSWRFWKTLSLNHIPILQTLRDYHLMAAINRDSALFKRLNRIYSEKVKEASNRYVAAVSAPSEYTLKAFLNKGFFVSSFPYCVPNAISYDQDTLRQAIKRKKERTGPVIFLFAGNLNNHKGVHVLKESLNFLGDLAFELRICGAGPLEKDCLDLANSDRRVTFLGKVDSDKMAEEYMIADVLVVPSVWPEPFGRVLIEGFQYACPAIATNCGGIPEIINLTGGGLLCEAGSSEALAEKISLMSNRSFVRQFYSVMESACSHYAVESQLDSFEQIYYALQQMDFF